VAYQSRRSGLYQAALERLRAHTYPCGCKRSEIADSALAIDGARVYGGNCRGGLPAGKTARTFRVRAQGEIRFVDRVQGAQAQRLERDVGDFVLWRADGQFAYQLAVVVDDAEQGVTDVVRGADLLDSTARQIHLQRLLDCATPRYLHVPVAVNAAGEKLSKQTGAEPVDVGRRGDALRRAFAFLGQAATDDLAEGLRNWDASRIPARKVAR
jgi:glutamyl-Q tRNA(Asp) synthetase